MLAWAKLAAAAAVVGLLLWSGWTFAAWRSRAHEADKLEQERDAAIGRERAAVARESAAAAARVADAQGRQQKTDERHEQARQIIKRIPVFVDRNSCALNPDGVHDLNVARGAVVPSPQRRLAGDTFTTRTDPGN
jgi:hypothetical protein